jgi:hypothetical protein
MYICVEREDEETFWETYQDEDRRIGSRASINKKVLRKRSSLEKKKKG